MLDLPDLAIIRVLFFIDLEYLLQTVNRVCKRLYSIILNTPILWNEVEFTVPLFFNDKSLQYITRYSKTFNIFNIAYSEYTCTVSNIEIQLINSLSRSKNLVSLTLSSCPISTLCFVKNLPNLEILDISQCPNLDDWDFTVINNCHKLDSLYLSFNRIKGSTIKDIVHCTPDLQLLDICGIYLTTAEIDSILKECYWSLLSFYVSLDDSEDEDVFDRFIHLNYIDLNYHIYRRF